MKKYRYEILSDLQGECESLSLDNSIILTDLVLKKDAIETAIFLLKIINQFESELKKFERFIVVSNIGDDIANQILNLIIDFKNNKHLWPRPTSSNVDPNQAELRSKRSAEINTNND